MCTKLNTNVLSQFSPLKSSKITRAQPNTIVRENFYEISASAISGYAPCKRALLAIHLKMQLTLIIIPLPIE